MPKPVRIPTLKHHKASDRAYVNHQRKRVYFGRWGLATTTEAYNRWVAKLLRGDQPLSEELAHENAISRLQVFELAAAYLEWAEAYYRKGGAKTTYVNRIERHLKALVQCHRSTQVEDFGPLSLRAIQTRLVAEGYTRQGVNELVKGIRAVFKWGVSRELVLAPVHQALMTVPPLKYGRSDAPETSPVKPVDDAVVDATLTALPEVIVDMVTIQRFTGMRPGEVCKLRPCDLDRSGKVWTYSPPDHKTAHLGRDRMIFIGPQAQRVLARYLLRDAQSYCFSPAESERKRREKQHEERKTPLSCGTKATGKPNEHVGTCYTSASYRRAITRAVNKVNRQRIRAAKEAGLSPVEVDLLEDWAPNQLRHSAGTKIRQQFGLEGAQVVLGHSKADVTQTYAERDSGLARQIAEQIG